ncbi:CUT domain protein [Ancylostoma caninum]|uniref:CUT domain protein n=2 Tax=Ancylostoma TaxID=29169 RepID=A0A368FW08_ANCCA|nr:CUT domain protein [Ancylostoma caninum]
MEGLESGGLAADPLLSAALSSPLGSSREDLFLHDFARSSPHAGALFGNYATLTTLQPLPPISTVTSNGGKFSRSSSPVRERQNSYFFPPSSQSNYNYNVNIKYEYDLKNEEDSNDSPPGEYPAYHFSLSILGLTAKIPGQPPCSTPSDYQNHASQPVETNFSSASFVPSYSGLEIRSGVLYCDRCCMLNYREFFRSPKIEKDCFFNGYTNGDCEVEEENACLPKNCSPVANGHGSMDGEEDDDGEELNTKDLAQRISAELKRYSIPQAIFAQKILCRSQGTLSDLLRNPKPWSKLKSGRETFRRMAKWLQEPEFKRMSDLRMAGP